MSLLVQIESGLHQGARHVIDSKRLIIGSSDDADVLISDIDVPSEILVLEYEANQWRVIHLDDRALLKADQNKLFKIGEPICDQLCLEYFGLQISLTLDNHKTTSPDSDQFSGLLNLGKDQQNSNPSNLRHKRKICVMVSFVTALTITGFFMASNFVSARNLSKAELAEYQRVDMKNQLGVDRLPEVGKLPTSGAAVPTEPSNRVIQSVNEILQDTQRKLGKTELFESQIQGDQLIIEARLSRRQVQIFERSIAQLNSDFGDRLQINAKVSLSTEQQIVDDIEVRQIVMGNMPFVILNDGTTLFAGSSYRGLTLSSINFDKLEFAGQQNYISLI